MNIVMADLLPYVFTLLAAIAVWVGVKRSRTTRNGVMMNGQSRLEERVRECEATIRTLLADNVRKEHEIQQLRQNLIEADRRIWTLERLLEQAELDYVESPEDRARIARMEQSDRLLRRMREHREKLMDLETESIKHGTRIPAELQEQMAAQRAMIASIERQIQELSS